MGSSSQEQRDIEKKLRKRERRIVERLQEAQEAQASALERFKRAEARLLKRMARTQRLEERLAVIRQQLQSFSNAHTARAQDDMAVAQAVQPSVVMENVGAASNTQQVPETPVEDIPGQEENQNASFGIEAVRQDDFSEEGGEPSRDARNAQLARSVAEAAEQAVRLAIERAREVAERLEQMATGRHLANELASLDEEIAQANARAQEAVQAAQEAEQLATEIPVVEILPSLPTPLGLETQTDESPLIDTDTASLDQSENPAEPLQADDVLQPLGETVSEQNTAQEPLQQEDTATIPSEDTREAVPEIHTGPSMAERERVEQMERVVQIDEDEEMVEMVAAMMIADVTAAAAAEAEALAEASSVRVREARRVAEEADSVLAQVRTAITKGTLTGDAADAALQDAERDATRAHAVLADAEVAEDRARRAAMDAEAEAEVAEGMALSASSLNERDERAESDREERSSLREQQHMSSMSEAEHENTPDATNNATSSEDVEEEDTAEIPIVRPQEQA